MHNADRRRQVMKTKNWAWVLVIALCVPLVALSQEQQKEQRMVLEGENGRLIIRWDDGVAKGNADFAALVAELKKELATAFKEGKACGFVLIELKLNATSKPAKVEVTIGKSESFLLFTFGWALPTSEERTAGIKTLVEKIVKQVPACGS